MIGLTSKQLNCKNVIANFIRLQGVAPTRSELVEILGLASKGPLNKMLATMKARGHLEITGQKRGIAVIENS